MKLSELIAQLQEIQTDRARRLKSEFLDCEIVVLNDNSHVGDDIVEVREEPQCCGDHGDEVWITCTFETHV